MTDAPRHPEFGRLTLIHGGKLPPAEHSGQAGVESAARAAARKFGSDLKEARRLRGFLSGRRTATFARELTGVLQDLKHEVGDTQTGIEIAAAFFRSDSFLFQDCDDSSGSLIDVFKNEGRDLFVHYAAKCEQKEWLAGVVFELMQENDYGARDVVLDSASEYLPETVIRGLIKRFQAGDQSERKADGERVRSPHVESLARQINDPRLYEEITLAGNPEPGVADCIDMGEAYLESGDPQSALSWLMRIPADGPFQSDRRDLLLAATHMKLGNKPEAEEAVWRMFRRSRNAGSFKLLLETIGPDQRDRVIGDETQLILETAGLSYDDADFLVMCNRMEEAEAYLLERDTKLDGHYYGALNRFATAMEEDRRYLAASIIYRVLLESILAHAISKYYAHGVRYLLKIDKLAQGVTDWRKFVPHETYVAQLRQTHVRKSSFWTLYEGQRVRGGRRR
jgi:tetratricopeptide (TPR) repeat protein